jgi:hypothetical protein
LGLNGVLDEEMMKECRKGRIGTSFFLAGGLILLSGSNMMVPRLRQVEQNYLVAQSTRELVTVEHLAIPQGQDKLIKLVPLRWRRCHIIWLGFLLSFPLTVMLEFSYSPFFGSNTVNFIIGFKFLMAFVEGVLSRSVREALLAGPLSVSLETVLFVSTMGADSFIDFIDGYFTELVLGIFERLVLGSIIG